MSGTLSQEEIELLVEGFNAEKNAPPTNASSNSGGKNTELFKPLDFSKPNKLQNENLGALKQIHEQFVKSLNKVLTMYLRSNIQVDMDFDSVEQVTYHQYINSGSKACLNGIFSISESNAELGKCVLQMKMDFCYFYIDKSVGANFSFTPIPDSEIESISEIDKQVATNLFEKVLAAYNETWNSANIGEFRMDIHSMEESTQSLNMGVMNSEMILVIPIDISIFQVNSEEEDAEPEIETTTFKIGIPYSVIEPVLDNLNISNLLSTGISENENKDIEASVSKMNNTVDCYLGQTVHTFGELIDLEVGDFISFNKHPEDMIDIYVGGVKKFVGHKYQFNSKNCVKIVRQED